MFPSAADKRAHKRAATRLSKEKQDFEQRVSELRDPAQIVQFVLTESSVMYRRGARRITLNFAVPVTNFVDWATDTGVITKGEDSYVKQLIRKPLTTQVRDGLKQEIAPPVIVRFECKSDGGMKFAFEAQLSLLR